MKSDNNSSQDASVLSVGLLTGGDDRPYALGIANALIEQGISVDFIGSDALESAELRASPLVRFLNLRGDQSQKAPLLKKMQRLLTYYWRLIVYALTAKPKIFHILWNNKYAFIDRVLLMLLYKALRKRVVMTVHNVNAGKRDRCDSMMNRATLRVQYRLCDHLFVHTPKMGLELEQDFETPKSKISVIPFGINNTIPTTGLTRTEARQKLGLADDAKAMLFFGQIAPYKGLIYLVEAMKHLVADQGTPVHLVIAGKVKQGNEDYWAQVQSMLNEPQLQPYVISHVRFIPDNEVELYLTASDVVTLPYVSIFQSGVPFLAYSFGLPVIATDVGSLREDIFEEKTGYVVEPQNPKALADAINRYFASPLYRNLPQTREAIRSFANERHSWTKVGAITKEIYSRLDA